MMMNRHLLQTAAVLLQLLLAAQQQVTQSEHKAQYLRLILAPLLDMSVLLVVLPFVVL
jgi:hypothetical protein